MAGLRQAFSSFIGSIVDRAPILSKLNPIAKGAFGGPLDLWNAEQVTKLKSVLMTGPGSNHLASSWWQGRTFQGMKADSAGIMRASYSGVDTTARNLRRGTVIGLGSLAALNLADSDPIGIRTAGNELLNFAKHATIAGTMYKMGGAWKAAGLGYVGLGAVNKIRGGEDHLGPY